MKATKLFIVLVGSLSLNSCGNSDEKMEFPTIGKATEQYIQVPIGFSGEITSITESPLVRASNGAKDYYAFQVYSKPDDESNSNYERYACGLFYNKENMIINLKTGYKYKFVVSMVVDGSRKVRQYYLDIAGWTSIMNSFFISSEEYVYYIYEGRLQLNSPYASFDRPNVDRFFGMMEGYVPAKDGTVQINMKRVSFGVKFVAKNFDSGSLEISVEGAPIIKLNSSTGNEVQDIISFNRLSSAYSSTGEYSESIPVNIVWVKSDNVRVPIASQSIEFKRNKLTTIEFEVKENTTGNSITLEANETMENGDILQVGGDGTNTGVNPSI